MQWRRTLAQLAIVAWLSGCAHGENALYGSYVAQDMAMGEFKPPVTLTLDRSRRFRFCVGERCAPGRWFVRNYGSAGDRLVLVGPELEAWMRAFLARSYGDDALAKSYGEIETDFSAGPIGAEITLGAGDAAFVKR
jgi:hypothetical protein